MLDYETALQQNSTVVAETLSRCTEVGEAP